MTSMSLSMTWTTKFEKIYPSNILINGFFEFVSN